jgi:hypothetical protein
MLNIDQFDHLFGVIVAKSKVSPIRGKVRRRGSGQQCQSGSRQEKRREKRKGKDRDR